MGIEKLAAFYESWNAMLIEVLRVNMRLALSPMYLWWSPWAGTRPLPRFGPKHMRATALGILGSGLAPVHRRAVANARRLRRNPVL